MALGAGKGRVIQMILRETGIMIVFGVVAGVIFTAIGVQLIKSTLFGLGVLDPLTVLSAVAILTAVALLA
jgi:ABC-type antimicrobial peptide transport system permease subunit